MPHLIGLLALPASLLSLTLSWAIPGNAQEPPWPYNLPRTARYFPEHADFVRRELWAQQRLVSQTPIGVKKLGHDPGEKFFLDYWEFDEISDASFISNFYDAGSSRRAMLEVDGWGNETDAPSHLQPILQQRDLSSSSGTFFGHHIFARAFQCPTGSTSCSSIGSANLCCENGETCVNLSNGVGCCPSGETCGSSVASCNTAAGYTTCGTGNQVGCCVPGASCVNSGCVFYGTTTITTTLPTATVTSRVTSASSSPVSPSTTASSPGPSTTVVLVSPSVVTSTVTQIISQGGTTATQTRTVVSSITVTVSQSSSSTAATCVTGFFSCPSSLGGGCCATGQVCESGNQCADPTSTSTSSGAASAPVLPTSVVSTSDASVSTSSTSYSVCPTGFYPCSAVYLGGCCQIGRNCDTTSCPATASTSIITTSGLTVVVPVGSGDSVISTATTSGSSGLVTTTALATQAADACAVNWFSCPASAGGGCCPSGYLCSSSCIATISGVANQPKETPSRGVMLVCGYGFLVVSILSAVAMVVL